MFNSFLDPDRRRVSFLFQEKRREAEPAKFNLLTFPVGEITENQLLYFSYRLASASAKLQVA